MFRAKDVETEEAPELLQQMAQRHTEALKRWAFARGSSPADVADLLQETFEKTLRARPRVRNDDELRAWLFVVLRNQFVTKHRAMTAAILVSSECLAIPASTPETIPLWRQIDTQVMQNALARLSPPLRTTFELRAAGRSLRDIAQTLNVPESTVAVRLYRARHRLRALITEGIQLV